MNIIFVTIAYPKTSSESNLYSDLMLEFAQQGHSVYVACSVEKRFAKETSLEVNNGINVLRIKTGNITSNSNYIAKGLALLRLQSTLIKGIKSYYKDLRFDLIIYSTPPIQYNRIIKYLKKESSARTYLLLKDIFPQNAIDMGLLHKWNPIYWFFRKQEKTTYQLSDRIGCMSPANVQYLLSHNSYLLAAKVEVCPNSLMDRGLIKDEAKELIRRKVREKLLIDSDDLLLVYGGNLGISQGLSFLLKILQEYSNQKKIKFLIVGKDGTWFNRMEESIRSNAYTHVIMHKRVTPEAFKEMLLASDIGLIFLNPLFTIPNFPSRLTSYLEVGLPVISCTDNVTDIGEEIERAGCGYKIFSGDITSFNEKVQFLMKNPEHLTTLSSNARLLFERSYTTKFAYDIIMSKNN